ncbi:AbrB family transcriptional regulator [Stigmatella aurantiaca]|uniref:AbrB protein n=1 Tax=Stigmatella aurantiaca (strain DW4/3-1) TaxID=378806 RepID=Q09A72_STIAD|nr:AbrB family transcriptional regulator [Stigmatella aurantiaca]ADO75075.1 AbrB protein [Stigmatella aurantiaca DW4/3-1]EAU68624.1 AbrB protein [Stigmatella aurantiaca DW4/3-1]
MRQDPKPGDPSRFRVWAVTVATLLGAALAEAAHVPAGALLGGMGVSLAAALLLSVHVPVPRWLMTGAQAVLGTAICASLTSEAWATLAENWPVALINVVGVVGVSQAVALLFSRWTGVDALTATLGLLPGGASAMTALSGEVGADERLVTFFQYLRLSIVILVAVGVSRWTGADASLQVSPEAVLDTSSLPWKDWGVSTLVALGGATAGIRLKLPAGAFLGPLLVGIPLTALGLPVGAWPMGLLPLSLWTLGTRVGSRFNEEAVRELKRVALAALGASSALVGGCVLLAWGWSALGEVDMLTAYFATSPGGADSVLAIALGTHASLTLVLAVQVGRLLFVFLVAPLYLRRMHRRR